MSLFKLKINHSLHLEESVVVQPCHTDSRTFLSSLFYTIQIEDRPCCFLIEIKLEYLEF